MKKNTWENELCAEEFIKKIDDFPLRNGITNVKMGDFGINEQSLKERENQHQKLLEALRCTHIHRMALQHGEQIHFTLGTQAINYYEGDAIISNPDSEKRLLACPTADCPTVIISTNNKDFAAIIHCGYRSLKKNIITKTLTTLKETYSIQNQDIKIGIFSGICGNCYRVGPEFVGGFFDKYLSPNRKLDLKKVILDQCLIFGIKTENINICEYCSAHEIHKKEHLYFSYRRNSTLKRNLVFVII